MSDGFADYLAALLGQAPGDLTLFERALTHASADGPSYERLEFLGDRVLGLVIARWLFERFPHEPEGKLSRRLNALVARETCALIGRDLELPPLIRLGKQARDDGANQSDNVVGDVVEALIGALLLDGGFDAAENFIRTAWCTYVEGQGRAPQHPKSALQEWAAAHDRRPPVYELVGRSGVPHAPTFIVQVSIKNVGEARGEGTTKQEAETEAAVALLGQVK